MRHLLNAVLTTSYKGNLSGTTALVNHPQYLILFVDLHGFELNKMKQSKVEDDLDLLCSFYAFPVPCQRKLY